MSHYIFFFQLRRNTGGLGGLVGEQVAWGKKVLALKHTLFKPVHTVLMLCRDFSISIRTNPMLFTLPDVPRTFLAFSATLKLRFLLHYIMK